MQYKLLTKEHIIISLDRLTRFKYVKEKYLRVFYDIILTCLTEPKYKRTELDFLPVSMIRDIAVEILNASICKFYNDTFSSAINDILKEYENSIFINDEDTQLLLDNTINYSSAINLISNSDVLNLRWLKSLSKTKNLIENRYNNKFKYPIEKVLLVEGITEEILLPEFAIFLGKDFNAIGIQVIPAGGKNQVVKMYYKLLEEVRIPIYLLLDKDAEENILQINRKLRSSDKIHLISCGEFEDLLPKSLIIKTLNNHFANFSSISDSDFDKDLSSVKNLELIFKEKGLHEFKKADFAKLVKNNITDISDISPEIQSIINEITTV